MSCTRDSMMPWKPVGCQFSRSRMRYQAVRLDKASAHTAETRVYSDEPFAHPTLLTTSSRRHERKQRTANQASAKSNRSQMACKGRSSRKAAAQEPEQHQPVAQHTEPETQRHAGRKEKLARQLTRLQVRNASEVKLSSKAAQLSKATWREARMADLGSLDGHKPTASRATKMAKLICAT